MQSYLKNREMTWKKKGFNHCKKTSIVTNQRFVLYSKAATYSHIGVLIFFCQNPWKILLKEIILGNVPSYKPAALLKK